MTWEMESTSSDALSVLFSELIQKNRPPIITLEDGQVFVYDDQAGHYALETPRKYPSFNVSSLDSFVRIVQHVMTRTPLGDEGKWSPVITVAREGAKCVDENDHRHTIAYRRVATAPWKALIESLGKWMKHHDLVNLFRRINLGLEPEVALKFRRISAIATTSATSAPELTDGEKSSSIALHLKVKSGEVDAVIPGDFIFSTPYTLGSSVALSTRIFVNAELDNSGAVLFKLDAPELESLLESVVVGEAQELREQLGDSVPVLENY